MSKLVDKLLIGAHPVILERITNAQELKEGIDVGMVHIRFPNTRGGTVLGIPVNSDELETDSVDFEKGNGTLKLTGDIVLDYVALRCTAKIDLNSLQAEVSLEKKSPMTV
ncbi:MbtH domain protein [Marinobacter halodurans]|uniref:MbtH domain protein n=1 Tax=Marinobacter halodurans TaxID=2528979 RepID=A0ABY1ZIP6_9GAMM|nr:MbtH domain protein [Marinobacter halodurans]TBW50332.1 MbtH domain protein [Marinobacter halodurans]